MEEKGAKRRGREGRGRRGRREVRLRREEGSGGGERGEVVERPGMSRREGIIGERRNVEGKGGKVEKGGTWRRDFECGGKKEGSGEGRDVEETGGKWRREEECGGEGWKVEVRGEMWKRRIFEVEVLANWKSIGRYRGQLDDVEEMGGR